jgi:hypothetical protein
MFSENYKKFTISLFIENKLNYKNQNLMDFKIKIKLVNYFIVIPLI